MSFDCGVCVFTCLCVCKSVRCFFILLRFSYFSVQDPGGPASFYTHARSNVTSHAKTGPVVTGWSDPVEEQTGFVEAACQNYEVLVEDKRVGKSGGAGPS